MAKSRKQQAAIAISMKAAGKKPKMEDGGQPPKKKEKMVEPEGKWRGQPSKIPASQTNWDRMGKEFEEYRKRQVKPIIPPSKGKMKYGGSRKMK